jgi:hypothetical protein
MHARRIGGDAERLVPLSTTLQHDLSFEGASAVRIAAQPALPVGFVAVTTIRRPTRSASVQGLGWRWTLNSLYCVVNPEIARRPQGVFPDGNKRGPSRMLQVTCERGTQQRKH